MTDREKKYLSDVLISVEHILSFTSAAVERHLAIIGEAINKFSKESKGNDLTNSNQIISLRNRLIHSYDNVDDRIIWTIVRQHLIPLKEEVEKKIG